MKRKFKKIESSNDKDISSILKNTDEYVKDLEKNSSDIELILNILKDKDLSIEEQKVIKDAMDRAMNLSTSLRKNFGER